MLREEDMPPLNGTPLWETDISPTLYNICRGAEFQTLEDVHQYYVNHGNFLSLKRVGVYRNQEFVGWLIKHGLVKKK